MQPRQARPRRTRPRPGGTRMLVHAASAAAARTARSRRWSSSWMSLKARTATRASRMLEVLAQQSLGRERAAARPAAALGEAARRGAGERGRRRAAASDGRPPRRGRAAARGDDLVQEEGPAREPGRRAAGSQAAGGAGGHGSGQGCRSNPTTPAGSGRSLSPTSKARFADGEHRWRRTRRRRRRRWRRRAPMRPALVDARGGFGGSKSFSGSLKVT